MDEKLLILENNIRRDLKGIADIYHELERHPLTSDTGEDTLIVIAYHRGCWIVRTPGL